MYVIAGLGNPGDEYAHSWHNAGFEVVDRLADQLGAHYWKSEAGAATAEVSVAGEDVLLAKPQSFMNTSGGPIKKLLQAHRVDPKHLVVVHDALDVAPGTIKVKFGGGLDAHNGLRSIADKLGTRDWNRVRVGIGRPPGRMRVADYVLTAPRKQAADQFQAGCDLAAQAVLFLIEHGESKAEKRFN
jgi:PTH1 family peptidyl-tRNA hydrolase